MSVHFAALGALVLVLTFSVCLQLQEVGRLGAQMGAYTCQQEHLRSQLKLLRESFEESLRQLTYVALQRVSLCASEFGSDEERLEAVRSRILQTCPENLESDSSYLRFTPLDVQLEELPGGFVLTRYRASGVLGVRSPFLTMWESLDSLEVRVPCRFFLLQRKMNEFVGSLDEIHDRWRDWQYMQALAQALTGQVVLSKRLVGELLKRAWAEGELETLGAKGGKVSPEGLRIRAELEVRRVEFKREDPLGLAGRKLATPIYLPGTTLWWGQWRVIAELRAVEEIQDWENPVIPRADGYHPLSYVWEFPSGRFETRILVILPRPFWILQAG